MAVIEIRRNIVVRREGILITGKILDGELSIENPVEAKLMRPYFGEFKVDFKLPVSLIRNQPPILSINGNFRGDRKIAKAGDEVLFQAKFNQEDGMKLSRIINSNRGKMPLYLLSGTDTKMPDNDELRLILKEQEELLESDVKVKNIWHPKLNNVGLVLQGGGVSGAFGVGALGLLDKNNLLSKKYITSIGSASTGTLSTAALIAGQHKKPAEITHYLEENYLTLDSFSVMGKLRTPLKRLMNKSLSVKQAVEIALYGKTKDVDYIEYTVNQIKKELDFFEIVGVVVYGALTLFGGPIGTAVGGYNLYQILEDNVKDALSTEKDKLKEFSNLRSSLATLEPTRDKLKVILRGVDLSKDKTNLRIALTSYETGATVYFTEKGTLLYPKYDEVQKMFIDDEFEEYIVNKIEYDQNDQELSGFANSHNHTNLFIEACLTSSAFPAIFDPKVVSFTKKDNINIVKRETFYDGGIRENLPVNEIRKTNISSLIAIHNSPVNEKILSPNDNDAFPPLDLGTKAATDSAQKYALRALSLMNNEIVQEDISLEKSLELIEQQQLDKAIHIAPSVEVVGLTETNLIRIKLSMFYGYLRAYDTLYLAEANEISNERLRNDRINRANQLYKNTDEIVLRLSKVLEQPVAMLCNGLLDLKDEKWDTLGSVKEKYKDKISDIKVEFVALKSDEAIDYYETKERILRLYEERLGLANQDKNCFPYEKDYNLFLTETFFSAAWASCDLYPLKDAKDLEFTIASQAIHKIVNSPSLPHQKGGGNFRVIHYNDKKTGNEAGAVFDTRKKLNDKISDLASRNLIINHTETQRKRLYNEWKRENKITN